MITYSEWPKNCELFDYALSIFDSPFRKIIHMVLFTRHKAIYSTD